MSMRSRRPQRWPIAVLSAVALAATTLGTGSAVADAGPYVVSVSPHGSAMACKPTIPCSLTSARAKVREVLAEGLDRDILVQLGEGTYSLSEALELDARDSGSPAHPVRWVGTGSGARIVGGRALNGSWRPTATDASIVVTDVPEGIDFDELFVDDERQIMARYPNYDESAPRLEGTTTLSTLNTRSSGWQDPTTGFVRAMQCHDWGSVSFTITGRVNDQLGLNFVGDNNRPQDCGNGAPLKRDAVLVENIREELDTAGEWFLDRQSNKLYLKPPAGVDIAAAEIETGELDQLITLTGTSPTEPIHDITLENLQFDRTHRTLFNSSFEGLSRGDWSVVRKGAAYLKNARDITITKSSFTDLGGNGVFMDGYNERNEVTFSRFDSNGATDVHVVGSPTAVRNYAGNYFTTPRITDLGNGPKTEDYPRDILIEGNVMKNNGRYEKQTSSVNLSMALDVTVRGNSLSDSPRACLNLSDNTWGGHLIQDNDIFDCVRETGDNGSINSWGRSRFWRTGASSNRFASLAEGVTFQGNTGGELTTGQARAMMHLDVIKPITIDHNRFWHDGDWAIDLDDGSSNFVITNNVLLKGGVKLRDGFERTMHNNLILDGSTFEQVSYMPGGDVIERNVTLGRQPYNNVLNDPVRAAYTIGKNLFWNAASPIDIRPSGGTPVEKLSADGRTINPNTSWHRAGMDVDSAVGDPDFANPDPTGHHDFTLSADSPALDLGFQNIPMTGFGAPGGALPPEAVLPTGDHEPDPIELARKKVVEKLMGADVTNITSAAEQSAYAISDFKGLKFATVPTGSYAADAGLLSSDLVRTINGMEVTENRNTFWQAYNALAAGAPITLGIRRASTDVTLSLTKMTTPEQLNNTSGVAYRNSGAGGREHWLWRDGSRGGAGSYLDEIDATQDLGDTWELSFNGTGLDIISQVNSDEGDVDLILDGKFYKTLSFYSPSREYQKTVLSITDLEPGLHTITGIMKSGDYMIVDAFKTHPASAVTDTDAQQVMPQTAPGAHPAG